MLAFLYHSSPVEKSRVGFISSLFTLAAHHLIFKDRFRSATDDGFIFGILRRLLYRFSSRSRRKSA